VKHLDGDAVVVVPMRGGVDGGHSADSQHPIDRVLGAEDRSLARGCTASRFFFVRHHARPSDAAKSERLTRADRPFNVVAAHSSGSSVACASSSADHVENRSSSTRSLVRKEVTANQEVVARFAREALLLNDSLRESVPVGP
jgi:3-oxoacyl-ACP reductase-like protein